MVAEQKLSTGSTLDCRGKERRAHPHISTGPVGIESSDAGLCAVVSDGKRSASSTVRRIGRVFMIGSTTRLSDHDLQVATDRAMRMGFSLYSPPVDVLQISN